MVQAGCDCGEDIGLSAWHGVKQPMIRTRHSNNEVQNFICNFVLIMEPKTSADYVTDVYGTSARRLYAKGHSMENTNSLQACHNVATVL
jgi:hypothetical protein